jgi:hypothetical protein
MWSEERKLLQIGFQKSSEPHQQQLRHNLHAELNMISVILRTTKLCSPHTSVLPSLWYLHDVFSFYLSLPVIA